jgi:hypothetical protein
MPDLRDFFPLQILLNRDQIFLFTASGMATGYLKKSADASQPVKADS